ncbi:MAG: bifunctional phosphopantothenoylcysteine decarboxylase/phosphopantothenate--cysteine ligase CoaBC [Rhodobacteraceae bacterium]|nr:MAG: bifunctional phosphopantothenoylcysteine decarboxylase/phosphopantothenate--cysteine ligase CoaBC [Paracoccaceae bacterium]
MMLGKRVLLIIGGGIAAYRSLELIRRLRERGCFVSTCLTKSGREFVTPLSVSALSEQKVHLDLFDLTQESEMGHIELSRSVDLIIVAPGTADIMSKMANGAANDLASTLLLATDKQILVAPAMNVRMWKHPSTRRNHDTLVADGVKFIGPNEGKMACGDYGPGRMSEPDEIADKAESILRQGPLNSIRVIITSGPTYEAIDPVRFIGNRSSGAQGSAIASALARLGADVTFITGPSTVNYPDGVKIVKVETADEMFSAVNKALPAEVAIFVAAVSDWKIENVQRQKIKKSSGQKAPSLVLAENKDILSYVSNLKQDRPKLVIGFAAESENILENASTKRSKKGCDWIVANDVSLGSGVMGGKSNKVSLISETNTENWPDMSKENVAERLVEKILKHLN